jgi:hypothetical protein
VRIHRIVLEPEQRVAGLPADTAALPFESWVDGWLLEVSTMGGEARVETQTGRKVAGTLVAVDPPFDHTFGPPPTPLQNSAKLAVALDRGRS